MTKKELRKEIRKLKSGAYLPILEAMSDDIVRKIRNSEEWTKAHTVLLYMPLLDEVDISDLLDTEKTVLLPVTKGDEMEIRLFTGKTVIGQYGIIEPIGKQYTGHIDLAIVPGMAFDDEGWRLGRGKGYYDHTIPHYDISFMMGVCFPFQKVESVPHDEWDIRMDRVIC